MMIAAYAARRTKAAIVSVEKKMGTNMQRTVLITGYQKQKRRMKHDRCYDYTITPEVNCIVDIKKAARRLILLAVLIISLKNRIHSQLAVHGIRGNAPHRILNGDIHLVSQRNHDTCSLFLAQSRTYRQPLYVDTVSH